MVDINKSQLRAIVMVASTMQLAFWHFGIRDLYRHQPMSLFCESMATNGGKFHASHSCGLKTFVEET